MKKKLVHLFMAALMIIGVVSCKEQEQSELEFSNIQDTAYVTGKVTYSLGQDTLSNDYVAEVIKLAIGRKVYVDIPLSSYQSGAQGNKIFTGVVDSMGYVNIAIPVKSDGISGATLRYEEFTAERAEYLKMENGKPVFEVRMNKFETPASIVSLPTLMPGTNSIAEEADMRYAHTVIDMKAYAETAVLSGKLLLPYEVSFHTGAYKDAANCQVEFTIVDGEDAEELAADAPKFTYGVVTNAKGEFALNVPIKNLRKGFNFIDAKVVPLGDAKFVHYTDLSGKSVQLAGAYELRAQWITNDPSANIHDVAEVVDGITCNLGTYPLKFVPGYNNGVVDPNDPIAWDENLAGWVFGEKDFASMTATSTLTGTLKLSQETAFAIGSYATSVQSLKITGDKAPYDKTFTVVSKADGTFELPLPVEQEGVNPGVSWSVELNQPNPIAFTHYSEPAKSIVLKEGTYTQYEKLRAVDAEWNQLGDFYFKFAPTGTVESWNADLAGWYVKEGYEETATVTAKLYVAQETAFAIGDYAPAKDLRVALTVVYPDENATLVAPVKADGTLSVVIPAKSANAEYTADAFELLDNQTEEFKHITLKGDKRLNGKFAQKYKFENKDANWNDKWTIYYSFTPTTTPDTWHADLAGWYKKDGYDKSASATGKAYFAKEKSYGIGEYQPAVNEVITVNVAELSADLQVPVKNDGTFSVAIPMKDAFDEYTLTASAGAVEVDDFVHYKDHGKTQTLEGKYIAGSPLKADEAAWNDLGTYYFKFDPKGTDPETYTDKLFGWQKYDEAKFPNKDMMITGAIKMAAETGFWKGTYEPYANEKVAVKYTLHGVDFEMVVLSDTEGAVECQAYRTFADDAPTVSIEPMKKHVKNYIHYYHATSPAPEKLEGNYSFYRTDKASTAKWNVAGTKYYKFTPSSTANDWSNDLVGWYVVPQKKDNAQFKLYAQKAIETSTSNNHEAKWTNASNVKAHVYVDGHQFDMVVSGKNLSFTLPTATEIEDAVTTYQVTITLVDEPDNSTQFTHYPDPAANNTEVLIGNYQDYGNIYNRSVIAEGKKFEIKESAKMMFYENGYSMPSGYSWDFSAEHDAI